MINNIKEKFPGIADGLVPEKNGGTIRDLIHILEEMEESIN